MFYLLMEGECFSREWPLYDGVVGNDGPKPWASPYTEKFSWMGVLGTLEQGLRIFFNLSRAFSLPRG